MLARSLQWDFEKINLKTRKLMFMDKDLQELLGEELTLGKRSAYILPVGYITVK
jgi:hypothetical protein